MADAPEPQDPRAASQRAAAPWVVGLVLLGMGLALILMGESVPAPLARGEAAPDFELPLLDDRSPVTLSEQRGRVVLLNFWATWCKPCEDEMPSMERIYRELAPEGFEMIAVSVDKDFPEVAAFRDRLDLSFPIAMDTTEEVARRYQLQGYPESLLIDGEGRLVERYVGPRAWDDPAYVSRIRALMRDGRSDAS